MPGAASASSSSRATCPSRPRSTTTASRRSIRLPVTPLVDGVAETVEVLQALARDGRLDPPSTGSSRSQSRLRSVVADAPTDDRRRGPADPAISSGSDGGVAAQSGVPFAAMTTERRPIRWGLLGTGDITRKLLAGAAGTPTAEIVAVGSRDRRPRRRAFAAANGIARAHGSYEALLADPEVDAVYISLPNSLHHAWTMARPGGRQARPVREALHAPSGGGRRGLRRGRGRRARPPGGVHVAPPPAGRTCCVSCSRSSGRSS